jgi:hypothetical protein
MQDLKSCLMSAEQSAVADGGMSYSAVQLSCVHRLLQENSDLNCVSTPNTHLCTYNTNVCLNCLFVYLDAFK